MDCAHRRISGVRCDSQGSNPDYPYFQNDEEYLNIHNVFGFKTSV